MPLFSCLENGNPSENSGSGPRETFEYCLQAYAETYKDFTE